MLEVSRVIVLKGEKVLLGKRALGRAVGMWDVPGGKAEPNESPKMAAQREISEETGIVVRELKYLFRTKNGIWLSYFFLTQLADEPDLISSENEHSEFGWFDKSEIRDMRLDIAFDHYIALIAFFSLHTSQQRAET